MTAEAKTDGHCFNCQRSENEIPLIPLRYQGGDSLWICPQCLPTLIHQPEKLTDALERVSRKG